MIISVIEIDLRHLNYVLSYAMLGVLHWYKTPDHVLSQTYTVVTIQKGITLCDLQITQLPLK